LQDFFAVDSLCLQPEVIRLLCREESLNLSSMPRPVGADQTSINRLADGLKRLR
jgi:hypothetical protein